MIAFALHLGARYISILLASSEFVGFLFRILFSRDSSSRGVQRASISSSRFDDAFSRRRCPFDYFESMDLRANPSDYEHCHCLENVSSSMLVNREYQRTNARIRSNAYRRIGSNRIRVQQDNRVNDYSCQGFIPQGVIYLSDIYAARSKYANRDGGGRDRRMFYASDWF